MKWKDVQNEWKNLSKRFQGKWSKLTDADITAVAGKREELMQRLQKHYPAEASKLEREVDEFVEGLKPVKA